MGAVYSFKAKIKFTDSKEVECVQAFKEMFVKDRNGKQEVADTFKNIDDVINYVANNEYAVFETKKQKNGFTKYDSEFDASYSWQGMLYDVKNIIMKFADKGSYIKYDLWE